MEPVIIQSLKSNMRQKLDIKQIINITMLVAILMMLGIISHIEPINSSRDSRK